MQLLFTPTRGPLQPCIMEGVKITAVMSNECPAMIGCKAQLVGIPRTEPLLTHSSPSVMARLNQERSDLNPYILIAIE